MDKEIIVPAIPEACKNKTFGASDIKWVKTVNDSVTSSAYLPPDNRVIENANGVFFCLQLNPRFRDSLELVPVGNLILLYQRLNYQSTKCFTHLVTPIGDKVITSPYAPQGWPGRWVKVIAMTENQVGKSIAFEGTNWQHAGFEGRPYTDLSFASGRIWKIPSIQKLSDMQNEIWNKFQQWRKS
jgi:hypothetical protein